MLFTEREVANCLTRDRFGHKGLAGLVFSHRKTWRDKIGLDFVTEAHERLAMSLRTPRRVPCLLFLLVLLPLATHAAPGVAVLLVDTDRVAGQVDERLYGQFLEEINHSTVDGLY